MDVSTMIEGKSCEESFSRCLQKKIEHLEIIYPASEEFKGMLTKDAFIKAKPNVIFFSMHYLINIYDPAEFKKRFYWPITDKKSEALYRTSLMQYFNSLKEKHDLQWLEVRSYLFIKPCGHTLMTFLNDFIDFIISERVTKLKKILEVHGDTKIDLSKRVKEHELYKSAAYRHLMKIDAATHNLREKSNQIKLAIEKFAKITRLNLQKNLDAQLINKFRNSNESLQHLFQFKVKLAQKLGICVKHFKVEMNVFLKRQFTIIYNKELLSNSYNDILETQSYKQELQLFPKNTLNLKDLFKILNVIVNLVDNIKYVAAEVPKQERKEMEILKEEILKLDNDLSKTEYLFNTEEPPTPLCISKSRYSTKFVCTPPVNLQPLTAVSVEPRLAFLNDFNKSKSLNFGGNNSRVIDNVSKLEPSCSSKMKSSIIKPSEILKSVTKKKCHKKDDMGNMSNLAVSWKERYSNLLPENTKKEEIPSTPSNSAIAKHNASPLKCKEIDIARLKPTVQHLSSSFEALDVNRDQPSPSGRLNSLVNVTGLLIRSP